MSAITTNYQQQGPSFASALWVTGVLLRTIASASLIGLLFFEPLSLAVLATVLGTDLIAFIWAIVRYSNAASMHLQHTGRFWPVTGGYIFFFMSCFVMVLTWWLLFAEADIDVSGQRKTNLADDAAVRDQRFVTEFSRDRRDLIFKGVVAQGAVDEILIPIRDSERLETLILNSPGGNVYEARLMAREVAREGLNTHVSNECSASCLLIFMAGQDRTLGPGAQLGFHRYGLDFQQVLPHVSPLREMRIDQQFYLERGVSLDFLDRVFDLNRDAIWYPAKQELLSAGIVTQ